MPANNAILQDDRHFRPCRKPGSHTGFVRRRYRHGGHTKVSQVPCGGGSSSGQQRIGVGGDMAITVDDNQVSRHCLGND
ncbi:hypothetical protein SAMN05421819_0859 [Bryocella elongata]|uniref:Uncharacterized protein n=1 Tax=Bryocella elongata TaxID=863522 RepID=A0A1H5U641_9BACT|nr:hypothetical protein [Bryocella elongata]SEF69771.1 hypothetical protein SAMN05421819_0859 [Bryocella elongata]